MDAAELDYSIHAHENRLVNMKNYFSISIKAKELIKEHDLLVSSIKYSLKSFNSGNYPPNWISLYNSRWGDELSKTYPAYDYPGRVFWIKVVTNLNAYREKLVQSIEDLEKGSCETLCRTAKLYTGISRKMDYDYGWMEENNKNEIFKNQTNLVKISDEILNLCSTN